MLGAFQSTILASGGSGEVVIPDLAPWNPADASSDVYFEDSNFRAARNGVYAGTHGVRCTAGKATGNWYYEFSFADSYGGNYEAGSGVRKSTDYLGVGGIVYLVRHTSNASVGVTITGNSLASGPYDLGVGNLTGVRLRCAFNRTTGAVDWGRVAGNWLGSGDPVTPGALYTIAAISGTWHKSALFRLSTFKRVQLHKQPLGAIPTGFSNWSV